MEKDVELVEFSRVLKYLNNEGVLSLKPGESKDFICPNCGGDAHGGRVNSNGHLHVWCDKCELQLDS